MDRDRERREELYPGRPLAGLKTRIHWKGGWGKDEDQDRRHRDSPIQERSYSRRRDYEPSTSWTRGGDQRREVVEIDDEEDRGSSADVKEEKKTVKKVAEENGHPTSSMTATERKAAEAREEAALLDLEYQKRMIELKKAQIEEETEDLLNEFRKRKRRREEKIEREKAREEELEKLDMLIFEKLRDEKLARIQEVARRTTRGTTVGQAGPAPPPPSAPSTSSQGPPAKRGRGRPKKVRD